MSIAWSTVAILVLLLPGFLFFPGFYSPERVSRDTAPSNPLGQLAGSIVVSFFIHGLTFTAIQWYCHCIDLRYVFSILQLSGSDNVSLEDLAENISNNAPKIVGYVFLTTLLGYLLGYVAGELVVKGPLRSLAAHKWTYDLINAKEDIIVYAHIMTKVREDEKILMYRGVLQNFLVSNSGAISYLILIEPTRYYLRLNDANSATDPIDNWQIVGETHTRTMQDTHLRFMMIEGSNIENVVFEQVSMNFSDEQIDDLKNNLDERIRQLHEALKAIHE